MGPPGVGESLAIHLTGSMACHETLPEAQGFGGIPSPWGFFGMSGEGISGGFQETLIVGIWYRPWAAATEIRLAVMVESASKAVKPLSKSLM
ncbi:MAG: hypothetical protein CMJ67_01585 [Planctomycetaceae bacterium]|nr:hypothetical protein [Planctomycetaceae bacterium]